jgi:hypothetical protein
MLVLAGAMSATTVTLAQDRASGWATGPAQAQIRTSTNVPSATTMGHRDANPYAGAVGTRKPRY